MLGFKKTAMLALLATDFILGNTAQAGLLYNIRDLGTLGGIASGSSRGNGINASGQVTGYSTMVTGEQHAFVTTNGIMTDLGVGSTYSVGNSINASGQVAGSYWNGSYDYAFMTNSNGIIPIGMSMTLDGNHVYSYGKGINDAGQVTGSFWGGGQNHTFITNTNGIMTDLGTLGGINSVGNSINASGQVTGSYDLNNGTHAFIDNAFGQMSDLGTLVFGRGSWGNSINSSGQVTGQAEIGNFIYHAFVTDNGVIKDLNTLLADSVTDWVLNDARGINDAGQITGTGVHNGMTRAFVLTPVSAVPVPGTVWLFGSGLVGLLSFNRKKNKAVKL